MRTMSSLTLTKLRQRHPVFNYDSYQAELTPTGLELTFFFSLPPEITFRPKLIIHGVTSTQWQTLTSELKEAWLFQLGLAELPSYWKATASPEIVIKSGILNQAQQNWWQKLLLKGMGEYFYQNQIDFTQPDFINWRLESSKVETTRVGTRKPTLSEIKKTASAAQELAQYHSLDETKAKYLLPLGGGKDSAAAGCFFKATELPFATLLMNPTPAMQAVNQLLEPNETITISRQIDPQLLKLNQAGYLNGHVPFSALLAFISRFSAHLFGYQSVVIANERSSNQGNVQYLGQEINHQYSKSFEFEQDFTQYLSQHHLTNHNIPTVQAEPTTQSELTTQSDQPGTEAKLPSYFSLLRPLYELQISRLLTHCPLFSELAPIFRSCNRGQKENKWCGECPKCLFTFISLAPFAGLERTREIFGKNLLTDKALIPLAQELVGLGATKPFECVGTYRESRAAFYLCRTKYLENNQALPPLLKQLWAQLATAEKLTETELNNKLHQSAEELLSAWNNSHQLPTGLELSLKDVSTT